MKPGRPRTRTGVLAAFLVAGFIVLAVLFAGAVGRAPPDWVPDPVQNLAFDVRLFAAPLAKKAATATHVPPRQARVYLDRSVSAETVETPLGGVPGTLYRPSGIGPHPGVLLLHGSTPEGRNMGLYRLLGRMLAQRGYLVLSIDHGSTGDAAAGLRMLESLDDVTAGGLAVVGHSGGAAVAVSAGLPDPAVTRLVAIGPGVRYAKRAETESGYFERRRLRYGQPARVEGDTFPVREPIEFHAEALARPDHKPLLLVQGEAEDARDRAFLRELHAAMAGPATLMIVPEADHYMNVLNFGPIVAYDPGAMDRLAAGLDSWLAGTPRPACPVGIGSCAWPGVPALLVLSLLAAALILPAAIVLGLRLRRRPPGRKPAPRAPQGIEA